MHSDDSSGTRPAAPIVLRIKLRYDDVEVLVQRFASNVGKSGLFLPTKSIQPIGTEIKFELRLADDTPAIVGLGRVKLAKPPDPHNPRATFGMAIELMRVTPHSRGLILRMLEQRRALGLPEVGLPTPDDIDAARRAEAVAAVGREPSAPVAVAPAPAVPAVAVAPVVPLDPHPGEALLTAPRRAGGPLPIAKVHAVAPLAPEPPRRKRAAVSEVIESASGPVASVSVAVPGLDDDVDVGAALSRARALAGDSPDAELAALCEVAAAPRELSVEAASAELARQLGGSAVRRDRSARWAPPPATKIATPGVPAPPVTGEPPREPAPESPAAPDAHHEVQPEQMADAIQPLDDLDLEDVEHTELGDIPVPAPTGEHGFTTEPSIADQAALAEQLEAQLAPADQQADADDLELARAVGAVASLPAYVEPVPREPAMDVDDEDDGEDDEEEIDDFEILAEADAEDEDLLAAHGEHDASGSLEVPLPAAGARPPSELDFAARLDLGEDSDVYAIPSDEFSARHALDEPPGALADPDEEDVLAAPLLPAHQLESARQALAAFDTSDQPFDDSEEQTGVALDVPVRRPEPVAARRPREPLTQPRREPGVLRSLLPSLLDSPVEDHELEHALAALDVDLDDLAIPHAAGEPRATTDDGVLIDFDDE